MFENHEQPQLKSVWDRLPKPVWKENYGSMDLQFPDGNWAHRSTNLGVKINWEDEKCRDAYIAYATIMESKDAYRVTHGKAKDGYEKQAEIDFQKIRGESSASRISSVVTDAEIAEKDAQPLIDDIIDWVNKYPQLFENYIEFMGPDNFVEHSRY